MTSTVLKQFTPYEHKCAERYADKQKGSMAEVFNIIVSYRPRFDDDDWYGHKAGSISGKRANEVIALIESKDGHIDVKTVGKVHKQVDKLVGGKTEVTINMDKAKAMRTKINNGEVKISHLVNGTKPSNGASAQQRSRSVTLPEKALNWCNKQTADKLKENEFIKQIVKQYGNLYS
jgi:hypothetical protein